jgi:nucleoside-diphosphate-sugar epimerase
MARWALTGGAGYIGGELARDLRGRGHDVRTLSRSQQATVKGDIRDPKALRELVRDADVVVHLAAYVHKRAGTRAQERECREINVAGTRAVVQAVVDQAPRALLINVSTANVYGSAADALDENAALAPRTLYGETKLEAEQIVRNAPLATVTLRPAMVFGPGAPGNLPRLVRLVKRGIVLLLGDGENQKTLAPVARVIAAIHAVAHDRAAATGQTYNVGGVTCSMRRILAVIAEELALAPRVISLPARPLQLVGRVADKLTRGTRLPSLGQMVETYAAPSVLSDAKLQRLPSFRDDGDPLDALRATIGAISASR